MKVIVLATLLCSVTGSLEIIFKRVESSISCGVCELLVNIFYTAAKKNEPMSFVKLKFVPLCRVAQNSIVCNGIFDTFAPDILEAFKYVQISPTEICSMLMEACPQMRIPEHEWTVNLTSVPKPRVQEKPRSKANNVIKILQINDIHLDTDYAVGSTSNCQEPLCCRNLSTNKLLARNIPAERWGSAECDTPLKTLDYILEVIAERHTDISYIMWLGDIAPHDIWRQTKAGQLITLRDGISALKRFFPNTLVLPTIGNHETKPDGSYPPPWVTNPNFSITWFSEALVELWKDWIPPSQLQNVLTGGYYSIQPHPGLKVLSLNTLYCHCRNWWLYVNSTDPAQQLLWLVTELQQAESTGQKVHIIGHIPPGNADCLKVWSRNYYEIVSRYESTITGQFFGHTHLDEFEVFYDSQNLSRPVSVAYIAPSITPFEGGNPSYRIYTIDSDTWEVIDYESLIMDYKKANKYSESNPELFKLYSAKQAYALNNLGPKEWNKLIYRMKKEPLLFDKFYQNYYTNSPNRPSYGRQDKFRILCNLKSGKTKAAKKLCGDLKS